MHPVYAATLRAPRSDVNWPLLGHLVDRLGEAADVLGVDARHGNAAVAGEVDRLLRALRLSFAWCLFLGQVQCN